LKFKASFESGSSYYSFKCLVPGAFNAGLIGQPAPPYLGDTNQLILHPVGVLLHVQPHGRHAGAYTPPLLSSTSAVIVGYTHPHVGGT